MLAMGHDDPTTIFCAAYPRSVWRSVASLVDDTNCGNVAQQLLDFLPDKEELSFFENDRMCLITFSVIQFNPLQRRRSPRRVTMDAKAMGDGSVAAAAEEEQTYKIQLRYLSSSDDDVANCYLEVLNEDEALLLGTWVNGATFIKRMLTTSAQGVFVQDNVGRTASLRSLHDGMGVGVFDCRGRMMTEVWHTEIGPRQRHDLG